MAEPSLDDLAMFVRVLERGGFSSAARSLGVPTSNVSRAIARLESQSGVQLLHRTTRTVKATSEGQELFASAAPAMTALRGAVRAIDPEARKPKGRLRVSAPNDLGAAFLADVIVGFTERYPLVKLDVSLSNAHANLVEEGLDVAIRATSRLSDVARRAQARRGRARAVRGPGLPQEARSTRLEGRSRQALMRGLSRKGSRPQLAAPRAHR